MQSKSVGRTWLAVGFSLWKKTFIRDFLPQDERVDFVKAVSPSSIQQHERIAIWGSQRLSGVDEQLVSRIEDGFIRSVGLGVDLTRPISLVVDHSGLYYDATRPSDLEYLLNQADFSSGELIQAEQLKSRLLAEKLTKYNLTHLVDWSAVLADKQPNQKVILVPGQVETDASIAFGSPEIKTNLGLLQAVRAACPNDFIIYKPHPDVVVNMRVGHLLEADTLANLVLRQADMAELLDRIDEVHTLTSLTGFEALLRNKKVVCYGLPFYAGWGLTEDRLVCDRRHSILTLEQLIVGALMRYPTYVHPQSRQIMSALEAVDYLAQQKSQIQPKSIWIQLYQRLRRFWVGVH